MSNDPRIIPAEGATAITPADATDFKPTRAIYAGASGDVKVDMANGDSAVTFTGLAAGIVHPLSVKRIYATGTTATSIVALY
jgi:hypothetical protein